MTSCCIKYFLFFLRVVDVMLQTYYPPHTDMILGQRALSCETRFIIIIYMYLQIILTLFCTSFALFSALTRCTDPNLTLTVLVATIDAQWEGMGEVGSARYELALLPPYPTIRVLSYSN